MKISAAFTLGAIVAVAPVAGAGVYTDDLTKCIVAATNKDDQLALVKWIYVALSKHPAVANLTKASDADIAEASKSAGSLFMTLLTEKCVEPTKSAVKYEGTLAIQSSFQVLGQVAMTELLGDPNVGQVMAELDKYLDKKKLESLSK